jgi:hypothetical protein
MNTPNLAVLLAQQIISTIKESGSTEEEALAGLQIAISLLPLEKLQSERRITIR